MVQLFVFFTALNYAGLNLVRSKRSKRREGRREGEGGIRPQLCSLSAAHQTLDYRWQPGRWAGPGRRGPGRID